MKVSIITTSKDRVWHIRDAMCSVLDQTYRDLEYILVDGGSTDGTLRVIREVLRDYGFPIDELDISLTTPTGERRTITYEATVGSRTVRLYSALDRGMYDGLNRGMRMATGDVVGMLHSDDVFQDIYVISEYVERFRSSHADLVYADGFLVNREDVGQILRRVVSGPYKEYKLRLGWTPLHCTCMVRRELTRLYGPYNLEYHISADTDWMVRYLRVPGMRNEYLGLRFVVRMRQGGVCTDLRHAGHLFSEDLRVFRSHGLWPVGLPKLVKMWRKVPQIFSARIRRVYWGFVSRS